MKKAFAIIFSMMLFAASSAFAQSQEIVVLIIGNSDFKTPNFIRYATQLFKEEYKGKTLKFVSGEEIQSKYQNYWLDKGSLEEGTPTKQDLIDFVSYGDYDRVVYLIIKDPVIDKHESGYGSSYQQKSRASVTVNAFLADSEKVLKAATSTKEDDSMASELRAKRGAFKQCMREISKVLLPALE